MHNEWLIFLVCGAVAALLTPVYIKFANRLQIVDSGTARGLHHGAMPRGGGMAIVLTLIMSTIYFGKVEFHGQLLIWMGCGLVVAILGFIDDICGLATSVRLLVQILCAFVVATPFDRTGEHFALMNLATITISGVFIVWTINAVNFMDGSDGLLASQAVLVSSAFWLLIFPDNGAATERLIALGLSGAAFGFLLWNWHPARVFLGDVGSYYIGYQLAALIVAHQHAPEVTFAALILMIPLLSDATLTLIRRAVTREKFWQAHNSHVYQLQIRGGRSHASVAVRLALMTIVLYLPLAMLAKFYREVSSLIFLGACLLASIMWIRAYTAARGTLEMR